MKFHERLKQIRQKRNISIRRICRDLEIRTSQLREMLDEHSSGESRILGHGRAALSQ